MGGRVGWARLARAAGHACLARREHDLGNLLPTGGCTSGLRVIPGLWIAIWLAALAGLPAPAAALTLVTSSPDVRLVVVDVFAGRDDRFHVRMPIVPADPADFDPQLGPVRVRVGSFSQTIPAGAMVARSTSTGAKWIYVGRAGALTRVVIWRSGDTWGFRATARGLKLSSVTNPLSFALDVGSDHGEATVLCAERSNRNKRVLRFEPIQSDDADGDGVSASLGDCDDDDPDVHPGAPELCNAEDDDCDEIVDEGFTVGASCSAGFGVCQRDGILSCSPDGGSTVCSAVPGASGPELCQNAADDDCDGEVDEGFELGVPCTVGIGQCARSGVTICSADGTGAVCDALPAVGCVPGPVITIVDPPNGLLLNRARVVVTGTVDASAVGVECNGRAAALGGAGFEATLDLDEGQDIIVCVATDADGFTRTANTSVTIDTMPPRVTIGAPSDGTTVYAAPITVTGLINDVVVGTVNAQEAQVVCNGVPAQIANRSFVASGVALQPGANAILCVGTDRAGNADTGRVDVTLATPTGPTLELVSGSGQTGPIGSTLPQPLVVALREGGSPVSGRAVLFQVKNNDGVVANTTEVGRRVVVMTDSNGRAAVDYRLGSWAGAGASQVLAVAPGLSGEVLFSQSATPGPAATIVVDSGGDQTGVVDERLPLPFVVVAVDERGNRLAGVPVTFKVFRGGGHLGGAPSVDVTTDSDGRAQAVLTLGPEEGASNNVVAARIASGVGAVTQFMATARVEGDPADTSITGVVLDNTDTPIAGVTVGVEDPESLTSPRQLQLATYTDAEGQFTLTAVPVGHLVLQVDGATAVRPGVWPRLEYDMVTVSGRENTVGMPIHLLPIDVASGLEVDDTHGGTLTLSHVPGFSLGVAPGSVTFLDGTTRGTVSVTLVHPDKVPMVPNFGQQPRFVVTIQPAGVHFNPPAPMSIPNVDALAPGAKTEMYSFDHDLGQFVSIGPGTVSEDGSVVASDPGVGVIKGGWHSAGPPAAVGDAGACTDFNTCTSGDRVQNVVDFTNPGASGPTCVGDAQPDGMICGGFGLPLDRFSIRCGDKNVNVEIGPSCDGGIGTCTAGVCSTGSQFNKPAIFVAARQAIRQLCEGNCIDTSVTKSGLRSRMIQCLNSYGMKFDCVDDRTTTACAVVSNYNAGHCSSMPNACTRSATLNPSAMSGCGNAGLDSIILHEMVHSHGCVFGSATHNSEPDARDPVYGCQESCFPGSTSGRGDPTACY